MASTMNMKFRKGNVTRSCQIINCNSNVIELVVKLLVVVNCMRSVAGIDHCSEHIYTTSINTSYMQFTKELINQDYAVLGQFKSLHCCAKGYRSIEWFKDGKPYPWSSSETSSLILYPEAANQTIYTRNALLSDKGKYSCVLRNDTHRSVQHIDLQIERSSPDTPLETFHPHSQYVNIGETARFYCEAFIGKVNLPDVSSDIKWYQVFDDNQEMEMEEKYQQIVQREDGQIIGSYLVIPFVTENDYGRYLCRVKVGNSPSHQLEMSSLLIFKKPIEAIDDNLLINPYFLACCAAICTLTLVFLLNISKQWWYERFFSLGAQGADNLCSKKKCSPFSSVASSSSTVPIAGVKVKKQPSACVSHNAQTDDTRIMMHGI